MRTAIPLVALCAICALLTGAAKAQEPQPPFGIKERIPWTTSRVAGTPEPPPPYTVERIFAPLTFKAPVCIAQEPGTNRILVAELEGKIYAFPKDNPTEESKELFLEIPRQIYSFSFHPDYAANGEFFVFSPRDQRTTEEEQQSRVSRFRTNREGPRKSLPESEEIVIEWLAGGHNGGEAMIGPDGYLYLCTGDSTSGSDPKGTGQGVEDLLSVMMRIDVDHPAEGKKYSVPSDNPFVHVPGARPEIWAFGFRNPWRFSFDRQGRLWCGDVGQDLWEMIWIVEKGGNYGWSVQEGSHLFHPEKPVGPGPIIPPIIEHHHTECRSITGGYVYYGDKLPELKEMYVYGDYEYGMIWALHHDGKQLTSHQLLADTALRIATFGVTRDGEFLVVDHTSGEIYSLVKAPETSDHGKFPRLLSETGLFSNTAEHELSPGLLRYDVNSPQWIDNGIKDRFLGLVGESKIAFVETNKDATTWGFDDGTVVAETISLEMEEGNPASRRRIETRMLVRQQNHWLGYSYLWNDQQTDAQLVEPRGMDLPLLIKSKQGSGETREQTWHVPSRSECMICHSRAAGFVLGIHTIQMNREFDFGGVKDNQLRAWEHVGLFKEPLGKPPGEFPVLSPYADESRNLNDRARSYLHVNCAVCHVSDGGGNARMVLRHDTKPEETKLFNERPMHGDFGLSGAHVITPGDPFNSVLFYRLSKLGRGHMPHVGSLLPDERGLELIYRWIKEMPPATVEQTGNTDQPSPSLAEENAKLQGLLRSLLAEDDASVKRDELLENLLSTPRGAFMLARKVVEGEVSAETKSKVIAQGARHPNPNVRDLFERFLPESQRTRRLGEQVDVVALLARPGDPEKGRQLFQQAAVLQCKNCHRLKNEGGTLGPDLADVGKRYKRAEILESLLEPSKKVDPKYVTHLLVTTQGQVLTGTLAEKTEKESVLNVIQDGKAVQVRVPNEEVDELLPQKASMMPEKLLRDLTIQEAADLLEFLTTLK